MYDSLIIGAGLSGLTSALLLARSGRRVLVLEQHAQPAPVARGFFRDGLYFDSGFHYAGGLGPKGAFRPLFRHLGLEQKLELYPFAAQGFDRLRIAATGETCSMPVGFENIKAKLGDQFPAVRGQINQYIDEIADNWSRFPYLDLDSDLTGFSLESVQGCSLSDRLQAFADYPLLQSQLSMHSLLYGFLPEAASATLNSLVAGSYYHSVHGIVGGGRALVEALLELLAEAGVQLRCGAEVATLLATSAGVTGLTLLSGEEIFAQEVIATQNPTLLPGMLPKGLLRPVYQKRLEQLRQTPSAYIVYAKSRQSLEFLRGSNLFVQPKAGIFSYAATQSLDERPFYLTAAGPKSDGGIMGLVGIVPAGYAEVSAWASAEKRRSAGYRTHKQKVGARLLKRFADSCPELAELELLELATPLTLHDYSLAPQGAIYGVGHFLGQYNPYPLTRIPGLFLSGQAIAAPGFLGAVAAGYLTSGSILGHESLRGEIRACR
ncbi:MAG: NAD(P)/FAD-dependent oxidoreductase [Desulfuromonadales bacterium]|nr:NAD(P)/FAD-dependent oxidoreductase [Desulfuromonadales bacterium]